MQTDTHIRTSMRFVMLLGTVSLFADATYEGARSITGPFLASLGASATVVGAVAGLGELIGYALRLFSGYISDRTQKYWAITLCGYFVNLIAVPMLALAGRWEIAALLIIAERLGKAIRTPARDLMLSQATQRIGRGWGFGLHEAFDQIGAVLGPLLVAVAFSRSASYPVSFGILLVPAVLALCTLQWARSLYPRPQDLEASLPKIETRSFPSSFWLYVVAVSLIGAGYADFPLIAYHFKKTSLVPDTWIPVFYAVAMGTDALAALLLGRLFDRIGVLTLAFACILSSLAAPLVFLGNTNMALLGILLWGLGMGGQESVLRAAVAEMVPMHRRGAAYGILNASYGVCWFIGSASMGVLYGVSIWVLVFFSLSLQVAAAPILLIVHSRQQA